MIKEGIDRLLSLAEPKSITIDENLLFVNQAAKQVFLPIAKPIKMGSLQGLVDLLKGDGVFPFDNPIERTFIHIAGHAEVRIESRELNADLVRTTYAVASCLLEGFQFNKFMPVEDFNIALQAHFVQDEMTAGILRVTGNVVHKTECKVMDDGRTQTVTAKSGIARVEEVTLPSQVTLRPYRTFLDIDEQPDGVFVLRIRQAGDQIMAALFEADSGLWKIEAVKRIKTWLNMKLGTFAADDPLLIIG